MNGIGFVPIIIGIVIFVLFLVGWVKILTNAGYNGAWVLIGFVPIVNLVMFLVFAFSQWPTVRERDALRQGYAPPPGYGPPGYGPSR